MEIKGLNNKILNAYKSASKTDVKKSAPEEKTAGSTNSANFDKIEFNVSSSIESAKADIKAAIFANADSARIEKLTADYSGERIPASYEKIAESIANYA